MKKLCLFLFLGLVVLLEGQAQSASWQIEGKSLVELRREQRRILPLPSSFMLFSPASSFPLFNTLDTGPHRMLLTAGPLPQAYRYEDLAFFCRIEVQMERTFKFPVKFRLGEVQYVERMEGKY